jgi:hypothetical protein
MSFDRDAELVFLDASCSGSFPERAAVWYSDGGNGMMVDMKQGFGFMNSPADTSSRYWKFSYYSAELGMSNVDAWLEAGNGCLIGTANFCDDESPIVYTKGNNTSDASNRASGMKMSNFQSYTTPTGQYYKWWRVDAGGC